MATVFDWDPAKDEENQRKHGVSFYEAQSAFLDAHCIIARDFGHSWNEERFYCFGKVGDRVMTVRFAYRDQVVRIIGAGYWRRGRRIYEEVREIH